MAYGTDAVGDDLDLEVCHGFLVCYLRFGVRMKGMEEFKVAVLRI